MHEKLRVAVSLLSPMVTRTWNSQRQNARRFAQECRDLAKSAKTAEEIEFLREREASWIKLAKEAERKRVKTIEMV